MGDSGTAGTAATDLSRRSRLRSHRPVIPTSTPYCSPTAPTFSHFPLRLGLTDNIDESEELAEEISIGPEVMVTKVGVEVVQN